MKAILRNTVTGETIHVTSTSQHPDCNYGQSVWVDKDNQAYMVVGMANPFYEIHAIEQENDYEKLGRALDRARRAKGIAVKELAERVGVSEPTIANLLKGRGNVSVITLINVANLLDLRLL